MMTKSENYLTAKISMYVNIVKATLIIFLLDIPANSRNIKDVKSTVYTIVYFKINTTFHKHFVK